MVIFGPPICRGVYPKFWTCIFKTQLLLSIWLVLLSSVQRAPRVAGEKKKIDRYMYIDRIAVNLSLRTSMSGGLLVIIITKRSVAQTVNT